MTIDSQVTDIVQPGVSGAALIDAKLLCSGDFV
jgi:hypothetical protein